MFCGSCQTQLKRKGFPWERLAWGRTHSSVPAERSSAARRSRSPLRFGIVLVTAIFGMSLSAPAQTPGKSVPVPKAGAPAAVEDSQLYRNAALGFRYRKPYGWVDRSKEMREQKEPDAEVLLAL